MEIGTHSNLYFANGAEIQMQMLDSRWKDAGLEYVDVAVEDVDVDDRTEFRCR